MHDPGRQSPRHLVRLSWLLVVVLLLLRPQQTSAQGATTWGWGRQQQVFDPELFADYLLSGQTPHPAVARIVAPEPGGVSLGSGVLVDANATQGLVLTNWHVIRDSRSAVLVQFPDGFQSAGTVIRFDEAWDLAAISIWKPSATPVSLARRNPALGEPLSIAGYGRGSYRAQAGRCTEYLSPGAGYPRELVELAAPARQGDSGGPILDGWPGCCLARVRAAPSAAVSAGCGCFWQVSAQMASCRRHKWLGRLLLPRCRWRISRKPPFRLRRFLTGDRQRSRRLSRSVDQLLFLSPCRSSRQSRFRQRSHPAGCQLVS